MRNGGKGREKPPLASRRGRPGHRGCFAPICPRRRPIVNRRPTEGGKGLAILRPGVMGLTVHRAPPFAPPRLLPSPGHHPTFRASHLHDVDRLSRGGCGGARTARNGVGGPLPIPPPPRAPRRSDSDHAKCGGVSITDSVFSLSPKCIGSGRKLEFFAHKYLTDQLRGVYFGPHMGGIGAHSPDIFGKWEIPVTR